MGKEISIRRDTVIVIEICEKGNIIFASRDFYEISGFKRIESENKSFSGFVEYDNKNIVDDFKKSIDLKKEWKGRVKNKMKNGDFYISETTVFKRPSGSMTLVVRGF